MKLVHVVPAIDQEAAGPSYSVPRLCQALAASGHDVELSCLAARGEIPGVRLDVHRQWQILRRFEVSGSFVRALPRKAREADIIHNHSLWSMVNVAAGLVVPGKRAKLVTSPRGTLSPVALARSRRVKQWMKPLQWRALERADLLHATSEVEFQQIRAAGLTAPVAVIPNGIDVPPEMEKTCQSGERILLYLGRVHPIKGIDRLLRAWQQIQAGHGKWRLVVAGDGDEGYVREVKDLARELKLVHVTFPGAFYGEAKAAAYQSADLFVLPTHTENFGMAVAEALAHACPVVVSKGAPWSGVVAEQCGWWVDNDVESLATMLDDAMSMPSDELQAMGRRGCTWMQRDFSWESVAQAMQDAYRWILGEEYAPTCVRAA